MQARLRRHTQRLTLLTGDDDILHAKGSDPISDWRDPTSERSELEVAVIAVAFPAHAGSEGEVWFHPQMQAYPHWETESSKPRTTRCS